MILIIGRSSPHVGTFITHICPMFYTREIPKVFNFAREKCANCDIFFATKMIIKDGSLIYFVQIVSFYAIINLNTKSFQLFCVKSSLNLTNFTELVVIL